MVKRILVLAFVVLALPCSVAQGEYSREHPLNDMRTSESLRLAGVFWDRPAPPCGTVHVYLVEGFVDNALARADPDTCGIWMSSTLYDTARYKFVVRSIFRRIEEQAEWERADFCTTMGHEYGHLLGFGHSNAERSLMAASPPMPRACAARFAPLWYEHHRRLLDIFARRAL